MPRKRLVDKDNFNDVLKAQGISMSFNVANKLANAEENSEIGVKLDIESIKDFEPDQIIRKVPELAKILELREALKALKSPLSNISDFRKKVQALVANDEARANLLKELGISEENKE